MALHENNGKKKKEETMFPPTQTDWLSNRFKDHIKYRHPYKY